MFKGVRARTGSSRCGPTHNEYCAGRRADTKFAAGKLQPGAISLIDIAPQISDEKREIKLLRGEIPSPINPPSGCVFRTRCPNPGIGCKGGDIEMGLIEAKPGHWVDRCYYECNEL